METPKLQLIVPNPTEKEITILEEFMNGSILNYKLILKSNLEYIYTLNPIILMTNSQKKAYLEDLEIVLTINEELQPRLEIYNEV